MRTSSNTRKVTLPNGNRVTITTRVTKSGYSKTVNVKRPNGTSETQTYRRGGGLFGTGLLDLSSPYRDDIPGWAQR
jgi:hypothetical protein